MEDILPTDFHLSQNYPNPFKEKIVIKYCVPYRTKIKLEVFNSAGERVVVLVNEIKQPGTYQVGFDATGLTSEIFFYKLQAGDLSTSSGQSFVETKRMELL